MTPTDWFSSIISILILVLQICVTVFTYMTTRTFGGQFAHLTGRVTRLEILADRETLTPSVAKAKALEIAAHVIRSWSSQK